MANKEISELTAAAALTGAELAHVVQSGNSRQTTIAGYLGLISQIGLISPTQLTADQNNYAPTNLATSGVLRLTSDAERNISGMTAGSATDPRKLLFNVGSFPITLSDEDALSSEVNRFALGANAFISPDELYIAPGGVVHVWYDTTSARWRPASWNNAIMQRVHGTITGSPGIVTEPSEGEVHTLTNNGAFSWFAPSETGAYVAIVTNAASAGAITASGFADEQSANFTTVNTELFEVVISNWGANASMTVRALQ